MISRVRFRLTLLMAAAGICLFAQADTLYLRAGEQQDGRLESMTDDAVVFQTRDAEKTIPKSDVTRIQLQKARQFDDIDSADKITDPDLKQCIESQPSEKDYPSEGFVTLLHRRTYDLTTPGVVKETNRAITKILRQRGEDVGSVNVLYFEDTDTPEIDFALTVTPDGRVLHLSDTALKNESLYARLPDYRRLARYRFACKEPRPGSILDVQYTVIRKRDSDLEPFHTEDTFLSSAPMLRKEVRVIVPADNDPAKLAACVRYAVHGADHGEIKAETQSAGPGATLMTWSLAKPQPGIVEEPQMPPLSYFAPVLVLAAPASWSDIATTYAEALAGIAEPTDQVKAKAAGLARDGGAQAIYNFVAREVRTLPVPQTQYRMTPHAPGDTFARGMANELDKNFLLFKMLEAADIPATFALVRDLGQGPAENDVPSLRSFRRSAVYLDKEKRFVNTASDLLPFDTLTGDLQGVEALLIRKGEDRLTRTQPPDLKRELGERTFEATLDDQGNLDIAITYAATGNIGVWLRAFKNADRQQLRNQLEQMAAGLHPGAELKDFKTTDYADLNVPPTLTMQCAIPGYAVKAGDDLMLFNLPVLAYDAGDVGRPTREHALFWGQVARNTTRGTVRLPEGFKVYAMPKNVKDKSAAMAYTAKLKEKGNEIVFSDESDLKVPMAPASAYAGYKACKERRADFARKRIILSRQ